MLFCIDYISIKTNIMQSVSKESLYWFNLLYECNESELRRGMSSGSIALENSDVINRF